jgi:hypothetical protein
MHPGSCRLVASRVMTLASELAFARPERVIPSIAAMDDAALVRRGAERIHPGLDRCTPRAEVDAAFDRLEAACTNDITER